MKKGFLFSGGVILLFLIIAYFIKISYFNFEGNQINDTLLGILIFHNAFILSIYVIIALALIIKSEVIKIK